MNSLRCHNCQSRTRKGCRAEVQGRTVAYDYWIWKIICTPCLRRFIRILAVRGAEGETLTVRRLARDCRKEGER